MSSSNTDFDATLVDWLYGELDAEAVASFEAHLEAHPEHKAEAHALRETRVAFQGLPEAEPSNANAVTAVLMQQAAAVAQPKPGVWASIVGFFQPVLLHPGAMAMATVVLVAGVAGTLYLRNGDKMIAETTVASSEAPPAALPGAAQPSPVSTPALGDESDLRKREKSADESEAPEAKPDEPAMDQGFAADLASPAQEQSLRAAKEEVDGEGRGYRQSANKNRGPEGLLSAADGIDLDDDMTSNAISGGAIATGTKSLSRDASRSAVDAPAKPASKTPARRGRAVAKPIASKKNAVGKGDAGWEDQQIVSFQTAARSKRCRDAGRIANDLKDKSPLAYDKNVKGTPEESDCSYYIASETKRRKTARKKALAKSKAKRKKGQGKSVPKRAKAAAAEDAFEADAPAQTENGL